MKNQLCSTVAILATLLFVHFQAFSQKTPIKYGKVSEEELTMTDCEFSPGATAMILGEFGVISFKYDDNKGFQYQFEYSIRIKIFDQSATDLANVKIQTYHSSSGAKEDLGGVKGSTFNLVNGKIVESKLEKADQFVEKINDRWDALKFAMPNVTAGSVIEYKYSIVSDYVSTLRSWQFQKEIPVQWSEFFFTIPEYYNYQTIFRGNAQLLVNESSLIDESFTYSYEVNEHQSLSGGGGSGSNHKTGTFVSKSTRTRWVAENLSPLKQEPFMTNVNDYAFQVDFQLQTIKYPQQPIKEVAGSYEKVNKELNESSSFGKAIEKGDFTKTILSEIEKPEKPLDYVVAIFEYIKSNIQWNEFNAYSISQPLNQTLKNKKGNVADINFLLISTLQDAGFEAYPVVVSTRSNGKMHPVYPSYEKMNYVVAAVIINGAEYLADASQKGLPFNLLKENCLNGKGYMVTPSGGRWINLQAAPHSENTFVQLTLENDELKGKMQSKKLDYAGYLERSKVAGKGEDNYASGIDAEFPDWEISLSKLEYKDIYSPVVAEIELAKDASADKLFINPILAGVKENPLKQETRNMPIDIPYGSKSKYMCSITIPEGYKVIEAPKPGVFALPEKAGLFRYNIEVNGQKIMISSQFEINKLFYLVEEYPIIQQFYSLVAAKNNELIVIAKE